MWVQMSHHTICWRVAASLVPKAPVPQLLHLRHLNRVRSIGLVAFPLTSVLPSVSLWREKTGCRGWCCMPCGDLWSDDDQYCGGKVTGCPVRTVSHPSCGPTQRSGLINRRSNSVGGMSLSCLVSPCFSHHLYQVFRSKSVFRFVFLFFFAGQQTSQLHHHQVLLLVLHSLSLLYSVFLLH